jgi:ABC-2 type transport system permease protein
MVSLRRCAIIARRVLTQISRDKRTLGFLLVFPVVFVLLFGMAFGGTIGNIRTAYINNDVSFQGVNVGDEIVAKLSSDERVSLTDLTESASYEDAVQDARSGRYSAVIFFHANLTMMLLSQQTCSIELFVDNTNPQVASVAVQAIQDSVSDTLSPNSTLNLQVSKLLNIDLRQVDFSAPGVIGFGVLVLSMILSLMITIRERKDGTLGRVLSTKATHGDLVLGYMLGFGLMGVVVATVVLVSAVLIFNVVIQGSLLLVYLIVVLFTESCVGLGIMLSAFARNEFQAVQFIPMVIFISIFLSGFLIPIESLPSWLQPVSHFVPLTYAIDGLQNVMLKGAGAEGILVDLLAFVVALAVTMLGAVWSMGKE